MSNSRRPRDGEYDHLSNVDDGAGCTEIWEKLSEHREASAKAAGRNVRTGGNER